MSIFYGYSSSSPSSVEVIRTAAQRISGASGAAAILWQDMVVDGRIIMRDVLDAIDSSEMCIFDVTELSENVLFEAGYAIARAKPVWLTYDQTVAKAREGLRELAVLNPIGWTPYSNSDDLVSKFEHASPLVSLEPVYDVLIEPVIPTGTRRQWLLYCTTFDAFEASNQLSRFLDGRQSRGLELKVSDPHESTLDPIEWLAPSILQSAGTLVHFAGRHRRRAEVHNRQHAGRNEDRTRES